MDIYLIVLRLIHIIAAFIWVGTGFYSVVILYPALAEVGADASKITAALAKGRAFRLAFPVSAGITVLAGILLYIKPGESAIFTSAGWMSISIGALAGLAAIIHGGAVLGRATIRYVTLATSGNAQPGELASTLAYIQLHGRISLALLAIAVLGMESARYLV
jgi:uncharacterized membrane protein